MREHPWCLWLSSASFQACNHDNLYGSDAGALHGGKQCADDTGQQHRAAGIIRRNPAGCPSFPGADNSHPQHLPQLRPSDECIPARSKKAATHDSTWLARRAWPNACAREIE